MDIGLPDMNGYEACKQIKTFLKEKNLDSFITASSGDEDKDEN
jgi:CheY-like chemotaxis protein